MLGCNIDEKLDVNRLQNDELNDQADREAAPEIYSLRSQANHLDSDENQHENQRDARMDEACFQLLRHVCIDALGESQD